MRVGEDNLADGRLQRVLLEQVVDGIPVFEGVVSVQVDGHGRVVRLAAGALHRGRGKDEPVPVAALGPEQALAAAVAALRPEVTPRARRRSNATGRARGTVFEKGPFASDIPASLVWLPTADGDRLAWRLRVEPQGFPQIYDVLIDAETGALLYRRNLVRYADGVGTVPQSDETALVDPRQPDEHPGGTNSPGPSDPPGGCPPASGYESRSLNAPFRDPGSVLFDGGRLRGNNTSVFRTNAGAFGALARWTGGPGASTIPSAPPPRSRPRSSSPRTSPTISSTTWASTKRPATSRSTTSAAAAPEETLCGRWRGRTGATTRPSSRPPRARARP